MIKKSFIIVFLFLVCGGILHAQTTDGWYTEGANNNPKRRIGITITNPLNMTLKDQPIVIRRDQLPVQNIDEKWIAIVDPKATPNPEPTAEQMKKIGGYLMRKETNGHAIALQVDDLDKDGIWDEIFFLADLAPKESRRFYIYIDPYERGLYEHHVHGAIGNYGRHTVPFIETEDIGWKLWFPHGLDMHGKRAPMLTAYYEYSTNKSGYYMPPEMGSDIMTVGQTFGAGTMCIFENGASAENPSRAYYSPNKGKGPLKDSRFSYDVVYNGPLRSMIKATTLNWDTGNGVYELEQYYSVVAHKSWANVEVKFTKFLPQSSDVMFGAGIRKMMKEYKSINKDGYAISMGKDVVVRIPDEDIGDAGLTVPWEGLGIVFKNKYKPEYAAVKSNGGNHLFRIPVTADHSYEYMVVDGWAFGSVNNNEEDFVKYVEDESVKYNNPPAVKVLGYEVKEK